MGKRISVDKNMQIKNNIHKNNIYTYKTVIIKTET